MQWKGTCISLEDTGTLHHTYICTVAHRLHCAVDLYSVQLSLRYTLICTVYGTAYVYICALCSIADTVQVYMNLYSVQYNLHYT